MFPMASMEGNGGRCIFWSFFFFSCDRRVFSFSEDGASWGFTVLVLLLLIVFGGFFSFSLGVRDFIFVNTMDMRGALRTLGLLVSLLFLFP